MATLTDAVIDAVALAHYFQGTLPRVAQQTFDSAEAGHSTLFVPEIALGEFVYTALRGRLRVPVPDRTLRELIDQIRASGYLKLSSLGPSGWGIFLDLDVRELHDRMIAADALSRGVPLVTNDPDLSRVPGLTVIWRRRSMAPTRPSSPGPDGR
ncbi:MAG: type II toxin-antitoxin system VapC family toxin [Thermoplasmata archaeon]